MQGAFQPARWWRRIANLVTVAAMIDLHQGFSGGELKEIAPTVASVAVVQLDAAMALARGQLRRAARGQVAAARLLGQVFWRGMRERIVK